jgi:GMP synthase (glutamine-hydrolysing)
MKVLVFRHVPFEDLGLIAPVLAERGIGIDYADLYRDAARTPDLTAYAGVISMGGPMSANDAYPYLDREKTLLTEAAGRGQPLLGVCLGSQLIARCLGARVSRNPEKEIGWFDIHFTPEAADDPLFAGLRGPETVFHWHGETWSLPPGAVRLAGSRVCRNQAFRAGNNIYGLQFHLEVTPAMIADWLGQEQNCGDVSGLPGPLDPQGNSLRLEELSKVVCDRWCALLG